MTSRSSPPAPRFPRGAFVALSVLFLARISPFLKTPQLFCEDGTVFFVDAYNLGVRSILVPYAGYLPLYQRMVAFGGSFLPYTLVPSWYLLWALLPPGILLILLLSSSSPFREPFREPFLAALLFVVAPFDATVVATLVNSQWILALALVVLALEDSCVPLGRARTALLVVSGLSGPFSVFLLPLFLLRSYLEPTRRTIRMLLIVGLCAAIEGSLLFAFSNERPPWHGEPVSAEWGELFLALFARPLAVAVGSLRSAAAGPLVLFAAVGGMIAGCFFAARSRSIRAQLLLLCAVALGGAAVLANIDAPGLLLYRERYALLPTMAIAWAVLHLLESSRIRYVFVVLFALASTPAFFTEPLEDLEWASRSGCIGKDVPCEIPLHWRERAIRYEPSPSGGMLTNIS